MVANLAVAFAKFLAAWQASSLALTADAIHSGVDAGANLIGLVVLRLSTQPPDEDHPFGHSKYETLAAFVLAGLLFVTAFELSQAAIDRLREPRLPIIGPVTIGVMLATLVVNVAVSLYETREGRRQGSEILLADAAQTKSDILVSLAVLVGLMLSRIGLVWADGALALLVAAFIAVAGYQVFRDVVPTLTDRIVFDPVEVARVVMTVPGVQNVHDIRSRGTPREAFVQMHLVVKPDDVAGAHEVADAVEAALERELGVKEAFIHIEPEDDDSGPPGSRGDLRVPL